jgi:hypothetical protein
MSDLKFELRNKERGVKIKLSGDFIRLGRAEDNHIVLPDPSISRYHLNLYIKDSALVVEDAGSKTGFFVNGVAQRAPVVLKNNDILKVGNHTYSIFVGRVAKPESSFNQVPPNSEAADARAKNKPRQVIIGGAVLLLLIAIFQSGDDTKDLPMANTVLDAEALLKTLDSTDLQAEKVRFKSRGEIEAEGKFQEGLREYHNLNYVRAIQRFEEALTQNPAMEAATEYLEFAQARLKIQIRSFMQDGQRSFALLQYGRAKAQFAQVLSILSEQIPGYWHQVSQKALSAKANDRRPAQEETLLAIPCEQTREQATCQLAVELIKQARQFLGEEDTIR